VRICLVTLDYPPFRSSGLTIYAESVARGLADRGHSVTVVSANRGEGERVAGLEPPEEVAVERVPVGRTDWIGFGWHAARYLRSHQPDFDIVHFADVHFAHAYRGPFIASAFQSFRQRLTSHHGQPYHTHWRNYLFRMAYYHGARWLMEQPSVHRAQHLIMPSAATQQEFIDHYGVEPSRSTLVYLGIDTQRFDFLPAKAQARRQLRLPDDVPVLLYVGFSTPRKGVEYLAQALGQMQIRAYLMMVGKWEANYQERFQSALGSASERVRIAGYVTDKELLTYFAAADAFVLPTLLEGFGIPLVEAMAAGIPTVTTDGGAAAEIVGPAGLTVPAGEAESLASALDNLLMSPDLASRLSQAGRTRARIMFDERRTAGQVESVYGQVLASLGTWPQILHA
jgi:glycosyltransferase involved in cell wall biosynthesis